MTEPVRRALQRRLESPYRIFGYRMDAARIYRPLVPDGEGRVLSETTGLWFAVSPSGRGVVIHDAATGELLRTSKEEEEGRKAAETELARLRAEIERLRGGG